MVRVLQSLVIKRDVLPPFPGWPGFYLEGLELKAIGININQRTYHFHVSKSRAEKLFYKERTPTLYGQIGEVTDRLLKIADKLTEKCL